MLLGEGGVEGGWESEMDVNCERKEFDFLGA